MAKHQFGQCLRGSKLGHGYVPGSHRPDDIDGLKKNNNVHISSLNLLCCVFNVTQYIYWY